MLQGKPQVSFESRRCMSAVGRCADHVLLNKTDLLEEGQLEELRPIVASLNPFATVRHRLPGMACACHVPRASRSRRKPQADKTVWTDC